MSGLRVLHMNLARAWRGGEQQTLLLMRGLRAMGHDNILLARKGEPIALRASSEGFETHQVARPFFREIRIARRADILHAHETKALQLAALASVIGAAPFIVTRRVDYTPGSTWFTRWKYRKASHVASVSRYVDGVVAAWGASATQRSVVYDAAECPDNSDAADDRNLQDLRKRMGDMRIIGCVAALVEHHKGQSTLLDAFSLVQRAHRDVALVLVGDGEDRKPLEAKASRLKLRNVFFEGHQSNPHVYYRAMDVFALTSRVEGLGSAILEAFTHRVPVVATSAGGIPELIEHGVTGWLAPIGDAESVAAGLVRMLDDGAMAQQCAANAADLLRRRHTPQVMATAYHDIYKAVLSTQRS